MYLYNKGIRYAAAPCKQGSKKIAVFELLNAMDDLQISIDNILELIPLSFLTKRKPLQSGVDKDQWPHLNSVIFYQIKDGSVFIDKYPMSTKIFREAYAFLEKVPWIYTFDTSYKQIIAREFDVGYEEVCENRMLYIPDIFSYKFTPTVITVEKVSQHPENGLLVINE